MYEYQELIRKFLYNKTLSVGERAKIKRESYRHPNGFTKIVFLSDDSAIEELRVHHWWPQGRDETDVHTHTSEFISVVGYGSLTETLWEISEGVDFDLWRCNARTAEGETILARVKSVAAKPISRRTLETGQHYVIGWDKFHSVQKKSPGHAISYVLQRRKIRNYSDVVRHPGSLLPPRPLTRALSDVELDEELDIVRTLLRSNDALSLREKIS
jgi:hypothetical protein